MGIALPELWSAIRMITLVTMFLAVMRSVELNQGVFLAYYTVFLIFEWRKALRFVEWGNTVFPVQRETAGPCQRIAESSIFLPLVGFGTKVIQ